MTGVQTCALPILGWVVGWDKGPFRGRAALESEREAGPHRLLRGLLCDGRQPPRAGYPVVRAGKPVGEVTSGNFSPCLERGIALAFLPPDAAVGEEMEVEMRGRPVPAQVARTPFVGGKG